ncbi:protein of unknown function (plasmid) [Cupriavidus taiwanensis]|uniref:Uncharacterized protein n=1 Tax=Cupriavidus taiwanensis TaxID=164546 RepID=A0A375IT79_9BURK|nr:protein of unknown function [Cupriavidus taiwanensis]
MYSYEDRLREVRLYLKLGKRIGATIRQLGYLKSLLGKPVDYGHVVRTRKLREDEERAAETRAAQERQQMVELVERYRGERVSAPDGSTYDVDSASIVITDANGRRSSLAHDRARAWLVEMDRVASGLAPSVARPAQARQRSSVVAHATIEDRVAIGVSPS